MTTNLQSISLEPGAALWLQDGDRPDAAAWHLESAGGHWWLSSPPLLKNPRPSEHLREALLGLFVLQAEAPASSGLRVYVSHEGALLLQWRVRRPEDQSVDSLALEPVWSIARGVWEKWLDVLEGRRAAQDVITGSPARVAPSQAVGLIQQMRGLLTGDSELRRIRVELSEGADEGALVLESPHESWVVGVVADPAGDALQFTTLIGTLSPDHAQACEAVLRALPFNSGPILGPHLNLMALMPESDAGLLLLQSRLSMAGAEADDIKAALGELLSVADELLRSVSVSNPTTVHLPVNLDPMMGLHLRG
jgi:hypothetical protein